ncbi:MAG: DegT/DnrJ/EryC1/StrS family aminotransferase, partial [Sarcina sp.]
MRKILFSPPDITQNEIDEVVDTLKSGWITTGPKTKLFEKEITKYCGAAGTVCLNSATAAMELALMLFDIGPGDEVITSAY